jgi:hypothetical protein
LAREASGLHCRRHTHPRRMSPTSAQLRLKRTAQIVMDDGVALRCRQPTFRHIEPEPGNMAADIQVTHVAIEPTRSAVDAPLHLRIEFTTPKALEGASWSVKVSDTRGRAACCARVRRQRQGTRTLSLARSLVRGAVHRRRRGEAACHRSGRNADTGLRAWQSRARLQGKSPAAPAARSNGA